MKKIIILKYPIVCPSGDKKSVIITGQMHLNPTSIEIQGMQGSMTIPMSNVAGITQVGDGVADGLRSCTSSSAGFVQGEIYFNEHPSDPQTEWPQDTGTKLWEMHADSTESTPAEMSKVLSDISAKVKNELILKFGAEGAWSEGLTTLTKIIGGQQIKSIHASQTFEHLQVIVVTAEDMVKAIRFKLN